MAQKKTNDFYVNISDPVSVRRNILESSRSIIHALQDYEQLKSLRSEKLALMQNLDNVLKEISSLMSKIKAEIPNVPQTKVKKTKAKETKKVKKEIAVKKEEIVPKKKSALESLEEELNSIENQLSEIR